ncbi:MAG: hypothetical protein HY461_01680 [Parcubacteria group bacterium]|nr:hypothetical protein [Parcubacteria group bacterium]
MNNTQGEKLYIQALAEAQNDPNILGLILCAGRGKGFVTEHSDYDVYIIVRDEKSEEYKEKYRKLKIENIFDPGVFSLSEFKGLAEIGSEFEWDRYNFAHLKAQVDKGGIQELINLKGILPNEKIQQIVEKNLDAYINSYYRSIKNHRDGNVTASHLDAAESIPSLLTALFAMNGRVRPYNKYLEWELTNYPLALASWPAEAFLKTVKDIISSGDIKTQKNQFNDVKELFSKNGFSQSINGWNGYWLG